jgi:hypothetical protein
MNHSTLCPGTPRAVSGVWGTPRVPTQRRGFGRERERGGGGVGGAKCERGGEVRLRTVSSKHTAQATKAPALLSGF